VPLSPDAVLVTILDGHPATLSWLGSAARRRVQPLGVERFAQSGDTLDLYRAYGIDAEAIFDAVAMAKSFASEETSTQSRSRRPFVSVSEQILDSILSP
jgi:pyruvate dehydrogenase complex dehydrogenase (E1) component